MMALSLFHVYLACLVFGVGYAVLMTFLGGMGGDHDGHAGDGDAGGGHADLSGSGHDVGHDGGHDGGGDAAHSGGLSPFSPLMIATFATLFGGLGFISLGILKSLGIVPPGIGNIVSVIVSGSLAMVLASYFSFFLVRIFVKTETSSNISTSRLIGREAEVALDLEPGKIGEIIYLHGGSRQNNMAKLAEGCPSIKRGEMVEIVAIQENVMVVKPWDNPAGPH